MLARRLSILLSVGLALGAALAPAARADIPAPPSVWFGLPGLNAASGAQWMRAIAYGTPPNVVYAGMEAGGVFRSLNGGATWSAFNSGFSNPLLTNVRALLTTPTGTTVYAGTDDGIYKSTGGAWQPLAQGAEADPANPKKLNQSVQTLAKTTGGTMLAGVFDGGVYRSGDDGATWTAPAVNNGMPAKETVYGLTENVPGVVYATAGSGVYVSLNQGSSWTRVSDGIPGNASPITTWAWKEQPQTLFTSTGSDGIYRSKNGGLTWSAINDGLGAVRARGMRIYTSGAGAHVYAATENGLWQTFSAAGANAPQPRWREVTKTGLITADSTNTIMWSLSGVEPLGPAGSLGLIAGTQSNGGYFLSFFPPDSACPTGTHTNTTSICPRVSDTTPSEAQLLTATPGTWTGTQKTDYAYQWQSCTTSSSGCSDIADAEESSYAVPESQEGKYLRVEVTATNPFPTFSVIRRYSAITAVVGANAANYPGSNQASAPDIDVLPPGSDSSPTVGDTMDADYGITPSASSDGWFNPKAVSIAFQWLRCNSSGTDCNEIPGATGKQYTLQTADGTHEMRVRVTGTNPSGVLALTSGSSFDVISAPAAITGAAQAPSLFGEAFVGETLAGSVGGWKDPTTDFERRWVKCDADGAACSYIQKVGSTDPEDGSTYTVRDADVGSTIRMRVTADVNNDLTPDGLDNFLPKAVEIDTPQSAVVAFRPVPGGGGAGGAAGGGAGGGVGGASDTTPPSVTGLRLTKKSFVAGKGTTFKLRLSEGGAVRVVITKATRGRKVGKVCKPTTRKNRKRKACTYDKTVTTLRRSGVAAGDVSIAFSGKVGKRKLARGTYRATFVVTDANGNISKASSLIFKIVRR